MALGPDRTLYVALYGGEPFDGPPAAVVSLPPDAATRPGQVEPTLRLREQVTRAVRAFRPEVVMTHDPTVLFVNNEWVNHPDHRAVGVATVDAVFRDYGVPVCW